jgi:rare lipoprotein A
MIARRDARFRFTGPTHSAGHAQAGCVLSFAQARTVYDTRSSVRRFYWLLLSGVVVLSAGCGHKNQALAVPPAPSLPSASPTAPTTGNFPEPNNPTSNPTPQQIPGIAADSAIDADFVRTHTPFYSEEGLASWYGPPYDKRRGANGEIFDQNALTAAHRTLPLNSLIEVTNLTTGQAAIMRVTDRGPFVPDRSLDLSMASAKAVGVWRPGVARVRIDVYAAPSALDHGGRWCVQIGAFKESHDALTLRDHLTRKYQTANVIEFPGPTGYWVRIRPLNDDKGRAIEIEHDLKPGEGEAYLVRLD